MEFFDIAECFEDQQVNPAFEQRCDLFAEGVFGFLEGSFSQRFNPDAQGPYRTGDPSVEALCSLLRQPSPGKINLPDSTSKPMPLKAIAITAKCVGFNDLRARLQIFMVDASYKIWLGQIQFVVAAIDENALGVQPRAHSAVAKKGG